MVAYRICFVCLGNICRSPTAEYVFRDLLVREGLADAVRVDSAGTGDWHVGGPPDERAAEALLARGHDPSAHRARQFLGSWFERYDLVLAMDRANAAHLRRIAPTDEDAKKVRMLREFDPAADPSDLDVPDPYHGGPRGFEHVLDLVEAAARGLLAHVRAQVAA